jgi:hypothetical protein
MGGGVFGHGVNLQPSYYNGGDVSFGWDLMAQYPAIRTVRIEIEPDKCTEGASWIAQAVAHGYDVVATYHKYNVLGTDSVAELSAAADWWRTNYRSLAAAGSFTINIMNEWGSHDITSNDYALAYNSAISTIREVYDGLVIIDLPGYGQETRTATEAVLGTNGIAIEDKDVALSVHVYPCAWNSGEGHTLQSDDLDDLDKTGLLCMVGEFGDSPSGSADWCGIVNYAKSKGWPVLGWAWNGDGGTMNMVSPAWVSDPTATSFSPSAYFSTVYDVLA